jgi:hypothetical protein
MPLEQSTQWSSVQQEEMAAVRAFRTSIKEPAEQHLVGLALSGGGIRSATFALGVLEALKSAGLLRKIDYLSTVSGGGYIGAWLSANCIRAARRREALREFQSHSGPGQPVPPHPTPAPGPEFVRASRDWLSQEADWTASISHLRRYSNYLSPKLGFFSADTWSMATTWIRNTLLIQFSVVLALAAVLLMPRLLVALFKAWPEMGNWRWGSIVLFVWAVAGIAHNQLQLNGSSRRSWFDRLLMHIPGCLLASAACLAVAWIISRAMAFEPFESTTPNWAVVAVAPLVVLAGFFLLPALAQLGASARSTLAARWPALKSRWPASTGAAPLNYTQGRVQMAVVLPLLVTGFLFAAVLRGQADLPLGQLDTFGMLFLNAWRLWPFPLCVAFASVWLLSFCSIRDPRRWNGMLAALLAPVPAVVALHALLCVVMLLLHLWPDNTDHGVWEAFVWAPALVLYAFSLSVVTMIGMMGRDSTEAVREWWSRLGAWLIIYGMAWNVVAVSAAYGPHVAGLIPSIENWSGSLVTGWLATTAASLVAGQSRRTGDADSRSGGQGGGVLRKALALLASVGPYIFIAGMMIGIATGIRSILVSIEGPRLLSGQVPPTDHWPMMNYPGLHVTLAVTLFTLAGLLMLAARVDINEFSLNAFYRSRLTRCYLGAARFLAGERRPQRFTQFDDDDDLRMAELAGAKGQPAAGPLHLINCALNLGGASDLSLHTRHSASFTVSPYCAGSSYPAYERETAAQPGMHRELGFRPIVTYAGDKDQPTLAQAISVSGAAASPNMGYHTSPAVAFLLTVFNMRLGWWFPNPSLAGGRPPSWFSLRYLIKELFGSADQRSKHLMISDGGHFENMAAYELIRRKCRVIIISDAECDPQLGFGGLGTLIRMAEVDFGAVITINLDDIRPHAETGWSAERYAVGTIDYGPSHPQGALIYLKAAMNGTENSAILQYKASHAAFPHESTGNQFYGEDQFESYRHLGREAAESAFGPLNRNLDMVDVAGELLSRSSLDQVARSLQESH